MVASKEEHSTKQDLLTHIIDYVSRDEVHTMRDESSMCFNRGYKGNRRIKILVQYTLSKPSHPKSMRIEVTGLGIGQYGELLEVDFKEDGSPDIKSYIKLDSGLKIKILEESLDEASAPNQYYTPRSSLEDICEVFR